MRKNKVFLLFFLFLSIIIYTVAYSGLATELSITSNVKFRPIVDIRIENIVLKEATNGAVIQYEPNLWEPDWNVAQTITGFKLPNSESSITYEVTVKNYGDVDQCIYSTSMDDESVNYQITGYTIKEIISAGQEKKFNLTFTPNTPSEEIRNIIVHYEFRKVFRVEYNANGGTNAPSMQRKYEREDLTLTTDVPTYTGHMLRGWSTNSSDNTVQYQPGGVFTLDQDTILYAKWQTTKVSIKMDMNGGTLSANKGANVSNSGSLILVDNSDIIHELTYGTSLPTGGLMDYNDIQNINIEKTGYNAVSGSEWNTASDGTGTSFNQNTVYSSTDLTTDSSQDTIVTLYVNWEPTTYSITYNLNGGSLEDGVSNPNSYNIETPDFTLNNPTKEGSVFLGWKEFELDEPVLTKTITTGTTGNKTLIAEFEDVQKPTISHTPTTWTNQDVTATVTSTHNDYTFMYKIDDGSFTPYNSALTITQNCTITAYSVKDGVASSNETHIVDNIDKINPTLSTLSTDNITSSGFDIEGSAQDQESGLTELRIYLKKSIDADFTYVTSINYSTDTTLLKNYSYSFTNLDSDTTYIAKVVGYDLAGNISIERTVNATTSEEEIIVARLIGYNNTDYDCDLNPALCKTFPTLKSALEYTGSAQDSDSRNCMTNQCTIQMLDSVAESNEILNGQEITLDLNGYTINGVLNYTFTNNGEFTIIDSVQFDPEEGEYNELNHNCIKNTTGTAIINNNVLNLGKYGTTDYVSIYEPYIYGATTGINTTNGTFNFYDGRIRATTAISGRVEDRPPMYDANVEIFSDPTNYQVATLSILSDAEARIDNKYYVKAAEAIADAKNGAWVDVLNEDDFFDNFTTTGSYGFVKSGNYLVNENETSNTSAYATIVLDLRDYDEDQLLDITTLKTINQSSSSSNSSSSISISTYSGDSGSISYYMYPTVGELSDVFVLPKGSRYNITLAHAIYSDSYPADCKLYITNMTLRDYEREEPSPYADMETTDVSTNYGFDYDPVTKSYKSNNQYTSNTTAFSYYEIDLTNETNNKLLIINATLSNNGSHYGYIYAKTDNNKETSYSGSNVMLSISNSGAQNYGPVTATKELQAGQKYYVQFYYQKNYDSYNQAAYESMGVKDQFIINSMDVIDKSIISENSIDLSTNLVTPGDYGFTANTTVYANSSETIHSYVAVDLTNTSTETYAELDFNSYYRFYTVVTDSPTLPTDYSNSVYHNPIEGPTYYGPVTFDLEPNKVNYIHFIMPPAPTGNTMLKSLKICNGKSYDIVNDFKKSKGANNGMDSYRYSYPFAMYPTSGQGDSYTEIDLRNSTSDVLLSVDAIISNSYLSYMYVSESNIAANFSNFYNPQEFNLVQNLLFKYNGSQGYAYINGDSYNFTYNTNTYNFVLSKGKKYYLHIGGNNGSFYVNKVITRNISSYDLKIGKSNFVDKSQVSYEEIVIDEDDESLRYVGSNPNNYVSFNNETWRIVGVFNTEDENGVTKPRIKLIKEGDIGSFSYDTSITDNNATGVNEWSESDIMKLLNPGYSNNQEELYTLVTPPSTETKYSHTSNISDDMTVNGNYGTNLATKDVVTIPGATKLHVELRYGTENNYDKVYIFKGTYTGTISSSTTGYYSRYTGGNSSYRYTSFDIEGDTVTFGFFSDVSVTGWGYHATVTDLHDPTMTSLGTLDVNNSLYWDKANGRCFTNSNNRASSCNFSGSGMDNAYKDYIDTVVWHTGAIPDSISGLTSSEILAYEQGSNTGKTNYTSQGSVDDSVTRTSTWLGKVGLPSPSDYLYASTWIRNGSGAWFINPVYNSTLDKISYGNPSSVGYDSASYNYAIRPTVYLSTKTVIASGDGSSSNPYVLSLGENDNPDMNDYYGLNPDEEEEDTGTVIYDETTDYQNIKGDIVYGFDYNVNGYYMNNNTGQLNSIAATYFEIDRTSELSPALVQLRSFLPNSQGNGVIVLMENSFDPNVNINNSSTYSNYKYFNVSNSTGIDELITLDAGKKYYFYMMFKTDAYSQGSFMIVYLHGLEDTTPTTDSTAYNGQAIEFNQIVDTVQLLKDVSVPSSLTIEETKAVMLDLNGHNLTTSTSSPIITNSGRLTIIDTDEGNNGTISATNNSCIVNNAGAVLDVDDGSININKSNYSAIDNYGTLTLDSGASINITSGYGIYNRGTGDILDGAATINSNSGSSSDYAIYNTSSVDTGFGGYTINNSQLRNNGSTSLSLHDINGGTTSTLYSSVNYPLTVTDSSFYSMTIQGTGQKVFDNVTVAESIGSSSTATLTDSNVDRVLNSGTMTVDGCTLRYMENGNAASSVITDSTIGELLNYTGSTMTLLGETIVNSTINNYATLNIGEDDGTVSTTYPQITGSKYAIEAKSTSSVINFYDGSLTGEYGYVLKDIVNDIPDEYHIISTRNDATETYTLSRGYVAAIGETGYYRIQDAIDAVNTTEETEIDLLVKYYCNENIVIPSNRNIKFDYNNHTLISLSNTFITNNGTLTLYNSPDLPLSSIYLSYSYSNVFIENNGTLNYQNVKNRILIGDTHSGLVNNGIVNMTDGIIEVTNSTYYRDILIVDNNATFNMSGGTLKGYKVIDNAASQTVTITGGTINHYNNTTYKDRHGINNAGTLSVSGITYTDTSVNATYNYFINNTSTGTATITGGSYNTYTILLQNAGTATMNSILASVYQLFRNDATGTLTVNSSTVSSARDSYNQGILYIDGSSLSATTDVLTNTNTGTVTIRNNSIITTTANTYTVHSTGTLYVYDSSIENNCQGYNTNGVKTLQLSGPATIDNSTILETGPHYTNYAITTSSSLTVTNSTITSKGTGIYNTGTGDIIIGTKGGTVSRTSPAITGGRYGINSTNTNAKLYFYDGIFKGQENGAIVGNLTEIEPNYDVITSLDNHVESKFLANDLLVQNITTGEFYSSIQLAVNEATTGDTLKMVRNYVTTAATTKTTIPSGKEITLDLNGFSISQNGTSEPLLENLGTLHVIDNTHVPANSGTPAGGSITNNTNQYTIVNSGVLTTDKVNIMGSIDNSGAYDDLLGYGITLTNELGSTADLQATKTTSITNAGTLTFDGYTLNNTEYIGEVIDITNSGTLTMGDVLLATLSNTGTADVTNSSFNKEGYLYAIINDGSGVINIYGNTNVGFGMNQQRKKIDLKGSSITNINSTGVTGIKGNVEIKDSATLNINGGNVTANIYGCDNSSLNITGGAVEGLTLAGYDNRRPIHTTSTNPIVIGTKDGTISASSPTITSTRIYADSGVEFYDGIVHGSGGEPIESSIIDIETGANVVIDSNDEYLTTDPIITNVDSSTDYTSISAAISAASSGDTLQMLHGLVILSTDSYNTVSSTDSITLDLNGKSIYKHNSLLFDNQGTLTITNSTGTGLIENVSGNLLTSSNMLTISGGNISGGITNTGRLDITGGTVRSDINSSSILNISTATIESGTITNSGTCTINSGTINSDITNTGTCTINGGTIGSSITNGVTLNITGGTFTGNITNNDTLTISNGAITKNPYEAEYGTTDFENPFIINNDTVTITGGTYNYNNFTPEQEITYVYPTIITNNTGATANISNITNSDLNIGTNIGTMLLEDLNVSVNVNNKGQLTITDSTLANVAALSNSGNTTTLVVNNSNINNGITSDNLSSLCSITLNSGTSVSSTTTAAIQNSCTLNVGTGVTISSTNGPGILNSGIVMLGTKDTSYNISTPSVSGSTYGISSTGSLNFYDGIISGPTAINGTVTEVETDYIINLNTVSGIQNATLKIPGENERVIIYNNINYSSLQDAINVAEAGTSTMVLYSNYVLPSNIVVPEGKTINFYLNNHTLDYDGYTISGAGTFNVINGTPSASISQFIKDTIASNMQLIILFFALIAITILVIVYHKKKNTHN